MNLTPEEKLEIKGVIKATMIEFRDALTEGITELDATEDIDEDTNCCTGLAGDYPHEIYLYTHLYDSDLISYVARDFWHNDTGLRGQMWHRLEETLSPKLYAKIEAYLLAANKTRS